ncbi:LCR [Medicago truncatula]|uniref:LCR n=1 Tax=Medicago truncatula TaxID=3880 RepID=A0A072V6M0_MEDTR|nr:LCR [Medicago truncatula]
MSKPISQYCLLGILYIALVLASGPTPGLSDCYYPTICDSQAICDTRCRGMQYQRGLCIEFPPLTCCCAK